MALRNLKKQKNHNQARKMSAQSHLQVQLNTLKAYFWSKKIRVTDAIRQHHKKVILQT